MKSRYRRAGGALLILNKIKFKTRNITRDKQQNFMMAKGSIHQKDVTTINIYIPINKTPICTNQK